MPSENSRDSLTSSLLGHRKDSGSDPSTPKVLMGASAPSLLSGGKSTSSPSGLGSPRRRRAVSIPSLIIKAADKATLEVTSAAASSAGGMPNAMNQTLIMFIMHFLALYLVQVLMQVFVMIVDYANEKNYISLGLHSLDFLAATDFFIVFLFIVEVGVQMINPGVDQWLKNWWHRFDLLVLIVSVLFVTVDIAQVSVFPCHVAEDAITSAPNETFELFRDLLRLMRIAVFSQQLKQLLENPLEHFSVLAEDLAPQADEIKEYI